MDTGPVLRAWGSILTGGRPNLSIEITRECPLRCPGCYAYGDTHLGGDVVLRELADFKGQALIDGLLRASSRATGRCTCRSSAASRWCASASSTSLLPQLTGDGRPHAGRDERGAADPGGVGGHAETAGRASRSTGCSPSTTCAATPATYDRILKHINGQHVTVHCTMTRQQARPGYVDRVHRVLGGELPTSSASGSASTRRRTARSRPRCCGRTIASCWSTEISALHAREPKLHDMMPSVVRGYLQPPQNPDECIFAKTTACVSADLKQPITPCQYGGDPDCTQCGCMASVGLQALGDYRLGGVMPLRDLQGVVRGRRRRRASGWTLTGVTAATAARPRLGSCSLVRHAWMEVVGPALPSAGGRHCHRRRDGRVRLVAHRRGRGQARARTGRALELASLTALLFDVDGTFIDSNAAHADTWAQALTEHGIPARSGPDPAAGRHGQRQAAAAGRRSRP